MCDLTFMNHDYFYKSLINICVLLLIFPIWDRPAYDVLVRVTSCGVLVPHNLVLLSGFDTICNNFKKKLPVISTLPYH